MMSKQAIDKVVEEPLQHLLGTCNGLASLASSLLIFTLVASLANFPLGQTELVMISVPVPPTLTFGSTHILRIDLVLIPISMEDKKARRNS